MLKKVHMINSFENQIKEPTAINFFMKAKRYWNKLPINQQTFDTYYNSMSESQVSLQRLVHTPGSIVTKQSRISQFNNRGRGRGGNSCGREQIGTCYFRSRGHGCGGRGGCGGRIYGKTHINFPKGTEQSWKKLVYTLYTNGYSYPHRKIIIFKK